VRWDAWGSGCSPGGGLQGGARHSLNSEIDLY
jgi:hypothetical protein